MVGPRWWRYPGGGDGESHKIISFGEEDERGAPDGHVSLTAKRIGDGNWEWRAELRDNLVYGSRHVAEIKGGDCRTEAEARRAAEDGGRVLADRHGHELE